MQNNQQQASGLVHAIGASLVAFFGLLARQADDVVRIGLRNVDDLPRVGVTQVDNFARPAILVSDDVLQTVDNIPFSESRIATGKYRPGNASVSTQESIGNELPIQFVQEGIELTVNSLFDEKSEN